MSAGQLDIIVEVGATFRLDVVWKDPLGVPRDNTGYAARMQFRKKAGDPVIIMTFTTENTAITLDGVSGAIHVRGLASLTEAITNKYGAYDLEMIAPNGEVDRILQGQVTFSPEVSRP